MTEKYPIGEWNFDDDIEQEFVEWFNSFYSKYSLRSEYFFGDCLIGDEKTRQDMMHRWIYASFYEGYNRGMHKKLEEEQKDT